MDHFDENFSGHAPAEGDRAPARARTDEERPAEDALSDAFHPIAGMKSQGKKTPPDALAPGDIDDAKRPPAGRSKKIGHDGPFV
jgi:hypothetical protein